MRYSVRITESAEKDLNSAIDYIEFKLLNPQAADNLLDSVEEAFKRLSDMPQMHALADDPILNAWGIRFVTINNYMAFSGSTKDPELFILSGFCMGREIGWIFLRVNHATDFPGMDRRMA